MQRIVTPTLAIVIAGSIAAGIALARPADQIPAGAQTAVASSDRPTTDTEPDNSAGTSTAPAGGFLGDDAAVDRGFLTGESSGAADDQRRGADAPTQATPAVLEISGFAFGDTLTVAPGRAIAVSNLDGAPHTVTADAGAFDTGSVAGGAGGSFSAPSEQGTYTFFCAIHPSMQGELIVQG